MQREASAHGPGSRSGRRALRSVPWASIPPAAGQRRGPPTTGPCGYETRWSVQHLQSAWHLPDMQQMFVPACLTLESRSHQPVLNNTHACKPGLETRCPSVPDDRGGHCVSHPRVPLVPESQPLHPHWLLPTIAASGLCMVIWGRWDSPVICTKLTLI